VQRTLVTLALLAGLLGCHRSKHYESNVEVTRIAAVRKDAAGKVLTLDFEFSYVDCPGTQVEVVRGDAAFAACVAQYEVGERVQVGLDHAWRESGNYEWTVNRIGACTRVVDPNDEASFAMVRECEEWRVNGTSVGFQCSYVPQKELLAKCPWFRRH